MATGLGGEKMNYATETAYNLEDAIRENTQEVRQALATTLSVRYTELTQRATLQALMRTRRAMTKELGLRRERQ
jgi:hypothetical protein